MLRSIGYKGIGLEGIPFDAARGVIPNEAGRVVDPDTGEQVPGHYAVGWIKRGPSGVIGTNKKDALETVNSLFEDLEAGTHPRARRRRRRGEAGSRAERSFGRARRRPRHLRGLAGDRRAPSSPPASRTAARGSSSAASHEMVEAARESAPAS